MQNLLLTISAIALVDSINPNAVAVQVYLLTTPHPTRRAIAFIAGDYFAAWIAGLLIAFGMAQLISQVLNRLGDVVYIIQFLLGVLSLVAAYYITRVNHPTANRPKSLKPHSTFLLGLTMAFVETPTALPFLAAIERITRANLTMLEVAIILAWYCFIFVLPLIILLAIYLVLKNRSSQVLDRISGFVTQWFPKVFQVVLVALGIVLIFDSVAHFFGASII